MSSNPAVKEVENFPSHLSVAYFAFGLCIVQSFRDESHATVTGREWLAACCSSECVPAWRCGCCQPCSRKYSLHLTLKISSEKWLLCSLVYSWYVTLFACWVHTSWRESLLSSWRKGLAWQMAIPAFSFGNTGSGAAEILIPLWAATCSEALQLLGDCRLYRVELAFQSEGHTCLWRRLVDSPASRVVFLARWCSGGGWQELGRGIAFTVLWWRLFGASASSRRQ